MKIKRLSLANFKRFTDLTIQDIPESAKLVLLIGSNGSGKSSVFDAFSYFSSQNGKGFVRNDLNYLKDKTNNNQVIEFETFDFGAEGLRDNYWTRSNKITPGSFYGRSSFRQVPRLTRTSLGSRFNIEEDNDRPSSFIDRDERFENDLEHIFGKLLREFFRTTDEKSEIKEKVINPINDALDRIFTKTNGTRLSLIELIPPIEGKIAEINFQKGDSVFHYNYLSAGEKEVFNILINFIARGEYYTDTVYYLDEIDLHLSTTLQFNLLKEITEYWIPDNCQFWTASHSLGFIEYAKQSEWAAIIDFDNLDFDYPQVLIPIIKDNPSVYEIAVGKEFLPNLFQHFKIIFVENKDKDYYGSIGISNTIFVSENNRNTVYHKVRTSDYSGIVDRDFLSDDDIVKIEANYQRLFVLRYYSIENYLYHPDNLEEYYSSNHIEFNKQQYIEALTSEKNQCKDVILPSLSLKRTEYPYFGEPEFNGNALQNRFKNKQENFDQSGAVSAYLNSNDFELFYKSLPMKTYCTTLPQRQNIPKSNLAKTNWFKETIQQLMNR